MYTRLVIIATVCFFALSSAAQNQVVEEEPAVFRVFPEVRYQKIEGFGAGLADLSALKPKELEHAHDLFYSAEGLRLNIVRVMVPPTAEPARGSAKNGYKYDWENDKAVQMTLKELRPLTKRPGLIFYAVPFTPPARWKDNKLEIHGGSLLREHYADYAEYMAEFLQYFRDEQGIEFSILSIQNEPDVKVFWPSCRWTGEELRDFIKTLGPVLKQRGLAPRLMLAEGSTWDQAWLKLQPALEDPEARKWINILGAHSYGWEDQVNKGRELVAATSLQHGIPVWMSEMSLIGVPDDPNIPAALKIAYYMYKDFVEGRVSAWIYCFTMFTPEFPGSMGVLAPAKNGKVVVPKRFWAFANYSRFVGNGWKRIRVDGMSFANTAFVSPEGDRFVIVALNAILNIRPATYDFGDHVITSLEAYRTSATEDLVKVAFAPTMQANVFEAKLAPVSVTTFVGTLRRGPSN